MFKYSMDESTDSFTCEECGGKFPSKQALTSHSNRPNAHKLTKCSACEETGTRFWITNHDCSFFHNKSYDENAKVEETSSPKKVELTDYVKARNERIKNLKRPKRVPTYILVGELYHCQRQGCNNKVASIDVAEAHQSSHELNYSFSK